MSEKKKKPVMPKSGGRGAMTAFIEEFATWQAAEGSWFFQGWPLPNPDPILRATGNALPVYRGMLYDAHIGGLVRRRRAAVKALDWKLETGKAKAKTVKLVKESLARLDVPAIVGGLWEAALFGYACAEVIWERRESHVLPRAVIAKPQEWFRFDSEGTMLFMVMGSANGVPVPPRKFLLARQDATLKNPYGIADLARCFWPHTFKKGGLQFWLKFVEKYGSPKLVGKFDRQTPAKEQEDLLASLEACVQDAVMVIPNDNSVEILKQDGSSLSGAAENYEAFLRFCRSEISIALLGQDQTTEADTNHASATAGLEVTGDIRDADAVMVRKAVQELVDWIVALNMGPDADAPEFVLYEQADAAAEAEADTKKAARDKAVAELRPYYTDDYLEKTYNLPPGALREEKEPEGQNQEPEGAEDGAPDGPSFAEPDPALAEAMRVQAPVDELSADLSPAFEAILAPVLDRLAQSGDYSEKGMAEAIAAEYPKMDLEGKADMLARARFVCRLWGYVNA